jgi:8-oxo-dGTP diphosphatase
MPPQLFEVGQKAFIERDGQVLILFRTNGFFDLPGGRIESGETDVIEALLREVREETSLEMDTGGPFVTWIGNAARLGRDNSIYLVGYGCRYVSGEVQLSDEHSAFRWVSSANYQELDDGSDAFKALQRYFVRSP